MSPGWGQCSCMGTLSPAWETRRGSLSLLPLYSWMYSSCTLYCLCTVDVSTPLATKSPRADPQHSPSVSGTGQAQEHKALQTHQTINELEPQWVESQPWTLCRQWAPSTQPAGAGRQTDRQTGACRIPRLYCKIVFRWQLQFSRHRLSVPQTLPSPVWGLPGGAEASQGEKHPMLSISQCGAAVTGVAALAEWGARPQEGVPLALGWGDSPVLQCFCLPPHFPCYGSCAGFSPTRPGTPGPVPQPPSC